MSTLRVDNLRDSSGSFALSRMVLSAVQATTSGTFVDFTDVPSWAKRITVVFDAMSVSGLNLPLVQIGSGSVVTSGYASATGNIYGSSGTQTLRNTSTSGFIVELAAAPHYGHMIITPTSNFAYVASHAMSDGGASCFGGGRVVLTGVMDRLRITATGGGSLTSGSVRLIYEG